MNKGIAYWSNVIMNFSAWSIILPLATGLYRFKRLTPIAKVAFYFVAVSSIFELISSFMAAQGVENIQLIPIWVSIEAAFISWIFHKALVGYWKKIVIIILILILFICLADLTIWSNSDSFSSISRMMESGIFIFLSLVYFYQLFQRAHIQKIGNEPMFWFGTAFFIYFCGNLFFFIASGTFAGHGWTEEETKILQRLFSIHSGVLIIRNILLAIGFWRIPKNGLN